MKTLYIFRHGETEWNKEKRFQGHLDVPLNEKGKKQAKALRDAVTPLNIECVLSSDLKRAIMTTDLIFGDHDIPIHYSQELREASLGEAEGKTQNEVKELWGEHALKEWFSGDPNFSFPGGEPKWHASKRAKEYINQFLSIHNYKTIAISTHGYLIYRILCEISDVDPKILHIDNCQIYVIQINENNEWRWISKLS